MKAASSRLSLPRRSRCLLLPPSAAPKVLAVFALRRPHRHVCAAADLSSHLSVLVRSSRSFTMATFGCFVPRPPRGRNPDFHPAEGCELCDLWRSIMERSRLLLGTWFLMARSVERYCFYSTLTEMEQSAEGCYLCRGLSATIRATHSEAEAEAEGFDITSAPPNYGTMESGNPSPMRKPMYLSIKARFIPKPDYGESATRLTICLESSSKTTIQELMVQERKVDRITQPLQDKIASSIVSPSH